MAEESSSAGVQPPASVQARRRLDDAERFLDTGSHEQAQDIAREVLGENPEYVAALCLLGRSYLAAKDYDAALPCFIRADMLSPHDPEILVRLAEVQFGQGAARAARYTAERALDLSSNGAKSEACVWLGLALAAEHDYEPAFEHLEHAAAANTADQGEVLRQLALCHKRLGNAAEAEEACAKAIKASVAPLAAAELLHEVCRHCNAKAAPELLKEIDALEAGSHVFADDEHKLRFATYLELARAAALECMGEHDRAWKALVSANAPYDSGYGQAYPMVEESNRSTLERAQGWIFPGPYAGETGDGTPLSLLILGPSETGKSVLERLVASLPDVTRGFDAELVATAAHATSTSNGFLSLSYPGQLPTNLHQEFSRTYEREAEARARGSKVLTITGSALLADLGRVAETLPNVKIVFVTRDLEDTVLRVFGRFYPDHANPFAYGIPRIRKYVEAANDLMNVWSEKLGGLCMTVSYEDMLADPQGVREKIAGFCGLPKAKGKLPALPDDRGCAGPYKDEMARMV